MNLSIRQLVPLLLLLGAIVGPVYSGTPALYPDSSHARTDLRDAVAQAQRARKHVLVEFGADWCGDCRVLESSLRSPENATLMDAAYVLVRINVGELDRNVRLAEQCGVALKKGIPALAVLDADGRTLYTQNTDGAGALKPDDAQALNRLLNRWKPQPPDSARAP